MDHILITGTGRAGTSFLVQLFTALELDTGYSSLEDCRKHMDDTAHAGLEYHGKRPAPYIVKSTHLGASLDPPLWFADMKLEHAFVCVRTLRDAANSRRRCHFARKGEDAVRGVPGGLIGTTVPEEQEDVLLMRQWDLLLLLAERRCPVTVLKYPRMVQDINYLHSKIVEGVRGEDETINVGRFRDAYDRTVQPQWIHQQEEEVK